MKKHQHVLVFAFTVASIDLGAHPEYLGANDIQLGKKESTEDTAKVLGRMFDGIEFRGFSQKWWKNWQNSLVCQYGMV